MEIGGTKTIRVNSRVGSIIFLSIFIAVGIFLVVFFSNHKVKPNDYYYVEGVVEKCDLEINSNNTQVVHSIAYKINETEYVWEYLNFTQVFYEGEKVNLKVDAQDPTIARLDDESKLEKKFISVLPIVVGAVFIVAGALGVISTVVKGKNNMEITYRTKR